MSELANFTQALFGAANTASNVVNDYTTNQAKLSTSNKQILLQNDITNELMNIQRSSNYMDWQKNMNEFFERVKSGMSDKNSQYYCQNNLQAEMFTSILEQNRVGVSEKVNQMVYGAQKNHALVEYANDLELYAQQYTGQDYINKTNERARLLYDCGYIDEEQLQKQYDTNFQRAYIDTNSKLFKNNVADAVANGLSEEEFINDVKKKTTELMAFDTSGLPKTFDKKAMDETLEKTGRQDYRAYVSDIQQKNANILSQTVQEMRQNGTAEGKLAVARRGQMQMNRMLGLQLSENDRLTYSALFELTINGGVKGTGSGSGSGAKKSDFDKYEDLIKANGDTAVQVLIDYPELTGYEAAQLVSDNAVNEWFTADYQENFDKDILEREKTFETVYKGATSKESVTDALVKRMVAKYPEVQALVGTDGKFTKLIEDMNKNKTKYGTASASDLSRFMLDTILESNANTTGEEIMEKFNKHINDCYVESCKYMEFDKKENLAKTYDATNAKDIASAAQLLHDKDMVYTYNGETYWAGQSKEALEKEGGLVDVMKNAVAGTIGADASGLDFYYQRTKNDMTNVPIITYQGNAYEVNATEDGKGFTVKNLTTGEVMDGVVPNKSGERKVAKAEAKAEAKAAAQATATTKKEREQKLQTALAETTTTPKAVDTANVIPAEEKAWKWETSTPEARREILSQANTKIQTDAKKVVTEPNNKKKNQYTKEDFKNKWNIDYDEWMANNEEHYRYELILNAK